MDWEFFTIIHFPYHCLLLSFDFVQNSMLSLKDGKSTVGSDHEMAQSERKSQSEVGKSKLIITHLGTFTKGTYLKLSEQLVFITQ